MPQPHPELLSGAPPAGLKPFGLVTQQPSPATPAGAAGLAAGDALLSFGEARHLRELQAVLQSNIGSPVVVLCVDAAGRYCRKYVVPAQWNPAAPKSLLGCQMSNQCPADHPAVSGLLQPSRSHHSHGSARRSTRSADEPAATTTKSSTCCSRCCLVLISALQILLVLAIFGLPTVSPGAADLLRLARLDNCAAPTQPSAQRAPYRHLQSTTALMPPPPFVLPSMPPPPAASSPARPATLPPSPCSPSVSLELTPPMPVSPLLPSLPQPMPPPRPPTPILPSPLTMPLSNTFTLQPRQAAEAGEDVSTGKPPMPAANPTVQTTLQTAANPTLQMTLQKLASSGIGLLSQSSSGAAQLLTNLQLHGQLDVDDMVLGILIACLVLAVIATLGLTIACSRAGSCARQAASTLYFVTSLPVWAALSFVIAMCFVFRREAESLVKQYWRCMLLTEADHNTTAWGAAAAVYQSITLTASMLLACNMLLLAGLYSAGCAIAFEPW